MVAHTFPCVKRSIVMIFRLTNLSARFDLGLLIRRQCGRANEFDFGQNDSHFLLHDLKIDVQFCRLGFLDRCYF